EEESFRLADHERRSGIGNIPAAGVRSYRLTIDVDRVGIARTGNRDVIPNTGNRIKGAIDQEDRAVNGIVDVKTDALGAGSQKPFIHITAAFIAADEHSAIRMPDISVRVIVEVRPQFNGEIISKRPRIAVGHRNITSA